MNNAEWYAYEIRSIDAIDNGEGWQWNASYKIGAGEMRSVSKRTVADALRRVGGVVVRKGTAVWRTNDDCLFELLDRNTGQPLYAVIVDDVTISERAEIEKNAAFPRMLNCTQCGGKFKAEKYSDYCPSCKEE